jgi:peptidoglycan LD-endopeptidase CwlK
MEPVIDSRLTRKEALAQHSERKAPAGVLKDLVLTQVLYLGFDSVIHQGQIVIHKELVEEVGSFFAFAVAIRFPIESVIPISDPKFNWDDELSCTENNSSGFNYRTIAGSDELSKHSHGRAFDINPLQNIYIRFDKNGKEISRLPHNAKYKKTAIGTLHTTHPLVTHMKSLGWTWGGDWTKESGRIDYQHFEKMK